LGGGFGGGGTTGGDLDFSGGGGEAGVGGEAEAGEAEAATEAGGEAAAAGEVEAGGEAEAEALAEDVKKIDNLLTERKNNLAVSLEKRKEKYTGLFVDRLISMVDNEPKPVENTKIYNKNVKINESINTMIKDIDDMLSE
jgi:hypothetical protein